jgi:hypothetical protein
MCLDHCDHRALCQWRLSQLGEDRRADDYHTTLADTPGLGAKSEECVGSCVCLPWLSLLKLMAPNDTRACNSGLALSARHLGASTLSQCGRMLRRPTRPTVSTQLLCGMGCRHLHQTPKRKRVPAYAYIYLLRTWEER